MNIKINNKEVEAILHESENKSNKAIFLIPGASGKALTDRYDDLAKLLVEKGFAFLRYESWKNAEELNNKTLNIFHKELNDVMNFLEQKGYNEIGIVGKSFGGGMALTYRNPNVKSLVLWAPAIGVSKEDNFNKISDTKFKEFERTKQIKLSPDFLSELKIPILIIGGTNDDVVDLKESEEKIKILDNAELFVVDGADHSYKIPEHKRIVVERTVEFFKNSL